MRTQALQLRFQNSAEDHRYARKDVVSVGNRKVEGMETVRYAQIDTSVRIFRPVQVEQIPFIGRIAKAVIIHVFDEIFDLLILFTIEGFLHPLYGELVARHAPLACAQDQDPFGFFWLLAVCWMNDQQKAPQRNENQHAKSGHHLHGHIPFYYRHLDRETPYRQPGTPG
jgi:hypothetical protein